MAISLPWISSRSAGGRWPTRSRPLRGLLPALLVMGVAAAVAASSARDEPVAEHSAPPPAQAAQPLHATPSADRAVLPSVVAAADIEAVAAAVSHRYRISQDATRELVGTAYGEGRRIGLDPLLIIAVMAVESHFNPIAQSDGGAVGLMQVIPRYHADEVAAGGGESVLDPRTNIGLGARVLKEYIRRGGTEIAGLQLYNGAAGDASNGYANRVLGERQRLQEAVRRAQEHKPRVASAAIAAQAAAG